jgi:hypothetical protein
MDMNKRQILFGVLLSTQVVVSQAQNLITNGSFETIIPAAPTLNVGSTNLSGWLIGGVGHFYPVTGPIGSPSLFYAKDGGRFITFNYSTATLSQTFPTIPNESYDVGFYVGYYQGNTNMGVIATVSSETGTPLAAFAVTAPTTRGWNSVSRFRFTAASSLTKLEFIGTNSGPNVDLLLDDVSVESVTRPVSIGAPGFQICWESKTNRSYQLQYRSTLITNSWTDLGTPLAGNSSIICNTQSVTEPQRFFRVVTLP